MKFLISWDETNYKTCWSCNSLIKAFYEVYGVKQFIIKCRKYSIRGSAYIYADKYDDGFYHMVSCFLTPRKINRLYKELSKNANKSYKKTN